ncbi:4-hydroxyphenylpyruvate dioxygenase [Pseudanabaena sp. FACHB-2040]|uniref:4-hydroxyphenylpyruvate dioxygenase n=1 Tax=Pseudanabaena sp. FACHB-2040 TaxID=2692859 RepID=UPI0016879C64|nr:4-hydroxyphenylpyruvate dioxygenase [Pseudanabaena sp. FACHB-2040]MBD2255957.1 4-hydroxyphenylpyruvate dioxygenase [Pseudanabaena sp. FACHB-2040]
MDIDHLHFYVNDGVAWRDWFVRHCGCRRVVTWQDEQVFRCLLSLGQVSILLSAPLGKDNAIATYLSAHPNGLGDLAFRVTDLESVVGRVLRQGGSLCQPIQTVTRPEGHFRWCQIQGWGSLRHTLIERHGPWYLLPWLPHVPAQSLEPSHSDSAVTAIDHAVLNVCQGDLEPAAAWYEAVLGFQRQQQFVIETAHSGLQSYVLSHPDGQAQIPINEPGTPNSQIQEFLTHHRGAGIQHVALRTPDIVKTVTALRQLGLAFLDVPPTYYEELIQRPEWGKISADLAAVQAHQILLDWSPGLPQNCLLQTFTQPVFGLPTFFFEVIERQRFWQGGALKLAQGFGEGNFQALFEAIEREQMKRGSLQAETISESC